MFSASFLSPESIWTKNRSIGTNGNASKHLLKRLKITRSSFGIISVLRVTQVVKNQTIFYTKVHLSLLNYSLVSKKSAYRYFHIPHRQGRKNYCKSGWRM